MVTALCVIVALLTVVIVNHFSLLLVRLTAAAVYFAVFFIALKQFVPVEFPHGERETAITALYIACAASVFALFRLVEDFVYRQIRHLVQRIMQDDEIVPAVEALIAEDRERRSKLPRWRRRIGY